jgi:hypothetical protein
MTPDPRDPINPRGPLTPDDEARSPAGLGPGDSLSPISPLSPRPRRVPAAEVKVRQVKAPRPLSRHPVVKYGGIGGLLAFLGGVAWYLISWFHGGTRP